MDIFKSGIEALKYRSQNLRRIICWKKNAIGPPKFKPLQMRHHPSYRILPHLLRHFCGLIRVVTSKDEQEELGTFSYTETEVLSQWTQKYESLSISQSEIKKKKVKAHTW
jgi:hypothetical protein